MRRRVMVLLLLILTAMNGMKSSNGSLLNKQMNMYYENDMLFLQVETFRPTNLTILFYNVTMHRNVTAFESLDSTTYYNISMTVRSGTYYIILWQIENGKRYEESYRILYASLTTEKQTNPLNSQPPYQSRDQEQKLVETRFDVGEGSFYALSFFTSIIIFVLTVMVRSVRGYQKKRKS